MGTGQSDDDSSVVTEACELGSLSSKKKHSGPRKRRPKKRKNGMNLIESALRPHAEPFVPAQTGREESYADPVNYSEMVGQGDDQEEDRARERAFWSHWAIEAAEKERTRRLNVLHQLQREEEEEILRRRQWAISAIEREQQAMMREMFLDNMKNTQWFQSTISRFSADYEVVCPNSWFGCTFSCMLQDLESHLESCVYRQVPDTLDQVVEESYVDLNSYDVVCPNAVLGCNEICSRERLADHLANCPVNGMSREKEWEERQWWRQNVILATEEERVRRMDEINDAKHKGTEFSFGHLQKLYEEQTAAMHIVLHQEITQFYQQCQQEASRSRTAIEMALKHVQEHIRQCWPHAQVEVYGSFATGLHGPASDVDLIVFGVVDSKAACSMRSSAECVQHLADYFIAHKVPSVVDISAITRASIPLLKFALLVDETQVRDCRQSNAIPLRIPFDITFDDPPSVMHNGLASVFMIRELQARFVGLNELMVMLKHFLVKRGLNDPYVGGLSSYGLLLMVIYVLQEQQEYSSTYEDKCSVPEAIHNDNEPHSNTSRCSQQQSKGRQAAHDIFQHGYRTQVEDTHSPHRRHGRRKRSSSVHKGEDGNAQPYILGKLLMDFLAFYGDDFRQDLDEVAVTPLRPRASLDGGYQSSNRSSLTSAEALVASPVLSACSTSSQEGFLQIRDPLQAENNVGKTCYRVSQVLREFSDFLSFLTALIVRGSVRTTHHCSLNDSHGILHSVFEMKAMEIKNNSGRAGDSNYRSSPSHA